MHLILEVLQKSNVLGAEREGGRGRKRRAEIVRIANRRAKGAGGSDERKVDT